MADVDPPKRDPEIEAIGICLRVLLPLDMAARSRVLEYLDQRLQRDGDATQDEEPTDG
jgi:hypothetical protein